MVKTDRDNGLTDVDLKKLKTEYDKAAPGNKYYVPE